MAKLSARGRTELLRVYREKEYDEAERKEKDMTVMWARWTRAYMSDGTVLEKYDVRFEPSKFDPKGRFHSYGWKRKGKITGNLTIEETKDRYIKDGWKVEK